MEALRMKALGELLDLLSGMPIPQDGAPPLESLEAPAEEKIEVTDVADMPTDEVEPESEEEDITGEPEPINFKMKK